MSDDYPQSWPLRPSHAAYVINGLNMAIVDLVHAEGSDEMTRRGFLKMVALATAAELFSREVALWMGTCEVMTWMCWRRWKTRTWKGDQVIGESPAKPGFSHSPSQ